MNVGEEIHFFGQFFA